ncbi:Ttll10 [Symbiodinium natans]|uniref:Ttll10 protein n=1 Tax=Symbiodinium natans TaxID=878477 RepID=A0A812I2C3_9DINO|nr:Ttll10 [Symbiodinium natans]
MAFSRRVHSLSSGYAGQRASSDSERTAAAREEADVEDLPGGSFPAEQRSSWLPAGSEERMRGHPATAAHMVPGLGLPPEALFCWTAADMEMYMASSGYVKPKLKLFYYISPECPQTIVDLVSPRLRKQNWACTVRPEPGNTPIFVWEGSRPSIDPAPTLSRGGLVNRVAPALPITRKVGMLRAVQKWCSQKGQEFPPSWYPLTFELPGSLEEWKEHVAKHPSKRWIYKPNGGARGAGIILVSGVQDVDSPERPFKERCRPPRPEDLHASPLEVRYFAPTGIIQEYVPDLQLLKGHKFAIRAYLLIARVQPLLVLLHGAAYAKVCGQEFDSEHFSQADLLRHVTEQEFQKMGGQVHDDWKVHPVMLLEELAHELADEASGSAKDWMEAFWTQVRQTCLQVVETFHDSLRDEGRLGMFEILGLDFVCKADGTVIFLEANRDPSWVIDPGAKTAIIPTMVTDMLDIVLQAHGDTGGRSYSSITDILRGCNGCYKFRVLIDETSSEEGLETISSTPAEEKHGQPAFAVLLSFHSEGCPAFQNSAFYEGEEARHVELNGRLLLPCRRLEMGDFLLVKLAEAGESSSVGKSQGPPEGRDELDSFLKSLRFPTGRGRRRCNGARHRHKAWRLAVPHSPMGTGDGIRRWNG